MASNNLEVERYVDAKHNDKHLMDGNEFMYKKSRVVPVLRRSTK